MALILKKGATFNLTKNEPGLSKLLIGLGWEFLPGASMDLDASVFMVGADGKIPDEKFFIFFNNLTSPDKSIQHMGDNRTGKADGDDEVILANLSLIDPTVTEIVVIVTIHEAKIRRQKFGMLQNAYIHIYDVEHERELLRYDLDAEFNANTEVEFGRLQKIDGDWRFFASGIGTNVGLEGIVDQFV